MSVETTETIDDIKNPLLGEFKPKRKYLNFVSAISGRKVRLLRETAFIKGEKLSGMLEGVIFKITICDEGTINFDEVDSNKTDSAMRKRLLDDIDSIETSGYAEKFIVSNLEFTDVDNNKCYLEVEHVKPFDKLKGLFDKPEEPTLSAKGLSILDDLFGDKETSNPSLLDSLLNKFKSKTETKEEEVKEVEVIKEETKDNTSTESYMQEQFRKMNEEKINELKKRISDSENDIIRYKNESKIALKNADEVTEKLEVLQTRLESLSPGDEPNGYAFVISDEQKSETDLDEKSKDIAGKIADLMKLKKDVLFKHLTSSFYKISIANKENFEDRKLPNDILEKLKTLDLSDGSISVISDGEFEYRGKLNWHQLTGKLIRKGFEQVPDFDIFAGSNSYEVKTERNLEEEVTNIVQTTTSNIDTKFVQQTLKTFDVPTDIVILGEQKAEHTQDFSVTDDESGYDIYIGGNEVDHGTCFGFGSILTIDEYKQWLITNASMIEEHSDLISAHLVPGFVGTVGISAKLEDGTFSKDFDINDYVCHQFDDYVDVIINLPEGSEIYEIPDNDLSKMIKYNRNVKLDGLGI